MLTEFYVIGNLNQIFFERLVVRINSAIAFASVFRKRSSKLDMIGAELHRHIPNFESKVLGGRACCPLREDLHAVVSHAVGCNYVNSLVFRGNCLSAPVDVAVDKGRGCVNIRVGMSSERITGETVLFGFEEAIKPIAAL